MTQDFKTIYSKLPKTQNAFEKFLRTTTRKTINGFNPISEKFHLDELPEKDKILLAFPGIDFKTDLIVIWQTKNLDEETYQDLF